MEVLSAIVVLLLTTTILQPANPLSDIDFSALRQIKSTLSDNPPYPGHDRLFFSSWNFSSPDPCSTFAGVTCSLVTNRVTTLSLGTGFSDSPGLTGTLSSYITNLTELSQLVLFPGFVHGGIPSEIGVKLGNLRVISLTGNRLTGPIPESISRLRFLHTLDLSHNLLTGTIPPGLTMLPELRVMVLASNMLTGELSMSGGNGVLLHLDLGKNMLSGMLPKRMPATLRYLSLSENRLWGPIEALESTSESLVYLDLSMNRFSGPIPESLFRSSSLSSLYLQRNNFSGRVPPPPLVLPHPSLAASTVDLSHNSLTGQLSTALVGVENLFLNNNLLSGEVPEEYAQSVFDGRTKTLYLQHNYITSFPLTNSSAVLPETAVAVCLKYNCIVPPTVLGVTACPASAGDQLLRPNYQCAHFYNESSTP